MSVSLAALLNPPLGTMNFNFKGSNCLYLVLKTDGPARTAPEHKFSPYSGFVASDFIAFSIAPTKTCDSDGGEIGGLMVLLQDWDPSFHTSNIFKSK